MRTTRPTGLGKIARASLPFVVCAICLWVLSHQIKGATLAGLPAQLRALTAPQIIGAVLCTAISFWAVGRYDAVAHRHFDTRIRPRDARHSGMAAIALSQLLGFGLATGTMARWRLVNGLRVAQAFHVTAFVTVSFMSALIFICSIAVVFLGGPAHLFWPAVCLVGAFPLLAGLFLVYPTLSLRSKTLTLPSLPALGAILLWAALDVTAAAVALYLLLDTAGLGFWVFLPAFLIALTAGLFSGAPAGVGPFELTLLALLPSVPPTDLLAGIIAFRAVYFALPAILALPALLRVPAPVAVAAPLSPLATATFLAHAPRAEVGVIRQNGGRLITHQGAALAVWSTGQTLTALFDPLAGDIRALLPGLVTAAKAANRVPCLYKAGAAIVLPLRRAGWSVIHIADEARLDLVTFNIQARQCRSLRRKLAQAQRAGIQVEHNNRLPIAKMQSLDTEWRARQGQARGGSMGRFCPEYMADQAVVLAWRDDVLVGFCSFHTSTDEWCLDVMRSSADAPTGTMHSAVYHAITCAHSDGIRRFNLAATVACPDPTKAHMRKLALLAVNLSGGTGLRQFKSAFGPTWHPLYMAAPSLPALLLVAIDLALTIRRPPPPVPRSDRHYDTIHNNDEQYELARRSGS